MNKKKFNKIMEQVNQQSAKTNKIKLDFKNMEYATGRRKRSIAKVLKKVQEIFMLWFKNE